jgi:uncharacterized protein (TIGR03437 family)
MLLSPRRKIGAFVFLGFFLCFAASPALAQRNRLFGPIQSRDRVTLRGQVPGQAQAANDEGPADLNLVLPDIALILRPSAEQQADLETLLAEQQDPASPNYHKWLTPEQYADRFGASSEDIARISDWLRQQGLEVRSVARSRNAIDLSGTVLNVMQAFGTEIRRYRTGDERHFANGTEPSIPAELNAMVVSIRGLDDFRMQPHAVLPRVPFQPSYTSGGSHYLAPADFAKIYNVQPLYDAGLDGTGQSIVVAGQTAIDLTDVRRFRSRFNLPANDPQIILVPGSNQGVSSPDVAEANLDLQWAGGIAPNARVIYVYSTDALISARYAIDNNLAPIISVSYGLCERSASSSLSTYQTWAQQANAQGITWINSAGDSGGADCYAGPNTNTYGGLAVDAPASVPEVTAIGGTTLSSSSSIYWNSFNGTNGASVLSYIPETTWNDSTANTPLAGGGGFSTFFTRPSWQVGFGVPNDATGRNVPDISFAASPNLNGYFIADAKGSYVDSTGIRYSVYGGTSAGVPAFGGILALLNQYQARLGRSAGLGNINPRLFYLAQTIPSIFHDITIGNNIVTVVCNQNRGQLCTSGSYGYTAGPGYDRATGLGSIDAYALVSSWMNTSGPLLKPSVLSLSSPIPDSALRTRSTYTPTVSVNSAVSVAPAPSAEVVAAQPAMSESAVAVVSASRLVEGATTSVETSSFSFNNMRDPQSQTSITKLVNAASFTSTFAPGMLLTVFGTNLSPKTWTAPGVPLPTDAAGVTVNINGYPAPIMYLSPTQINLQIPDAVPPGQSATLTVNNNGATTSMNFTPAAAAPGIFVDQNHAPISGTRGAVGDTMTLQVTGVGTRAEEIGVAVGGISALAASQAKPPTLPGVIQIDYRIPEGVTPGNNPVVVYVGTAPSVPAILEVTK